MKSIKRYILAGALGFSMLSMAAQEAARTGYFLEGYTFRHELNPAFAPERNYVSIPVLANMNFGLNGNIGVNKMLYRLPNGQLTTFMNGAVDGNEFLSKLSKNNKVAANINLTLLSAGFRAFNGYNTVTLGVKADMGVNVPKDLFTFMKMGQDAGADTRYDIKNLRMKANAYAELAFGHQRQITPELAAGAKVKLLFGLGYADVNLKQMDVTMGYDKWSVAAQGQMTLAAGSNLVVPTNLESGKDLDKPERHNQIDYDGIDYSSPSLAGFGLGFDLGATYDMHNYVEGLTLSAALTDLGFISWNNAHKAITPSTTWEFSGFSDIALSDKQENYDENKLGEQFDHIFDDLEDCVNFERDGAKGSATSALAATLAIGAEYKMPFYQRLSGGFLFSHRFAGCFSWTEGRFSANVKPVDWFDATINYGASTFGSSFGWMLNFHPKGFNFFIGSDHQFFKVTPQMLPVGNMNANLTLGMSVTFGSKAKKVEVKG